MAKHEGWGLPRRFRAHVRRSGLIRPGDGIVVALSGGVDSVVLLDLLLRLPAGWELRLSAAHFDHAMRPESADDAAWVAAHCRERGVPLDSARASTSPRSEAEARAARYEFLRQVARTRDARRIATAHQADDQAETVLFRIIRGTGLRGLRGIPARRGMLVRPLLPFRRVEIEAHARESALHWREDPSNLDLRFARNRIRHDLLPALERGSPDVRRALRHLARAAAQAEAGWDAALGAVEAQVVQGHAGGGVELARSVLLSYHPEVRARLLRRLLRRFGSVPGRRGTRAAVAFISSGASGHAVDLAGGWVLERDFDVVRIRPSAAREGPVDLPLRIGGPDAGAGLVVVGGRRLRADWCVTPRVEDEAGSLATLALSAVRFPLELRAWRPGDRIALPYGTKKLKKLFGERRVGRLDRGRAPVLADRDGRVLWIAGLARAAHVKPTTGEPVFRLVVRDAEHR